MNKKLASGMYDHHQKVIDRLVELHSNDSRYIALIVCGSLATGKTRPTSDVDIYLVATDEEFATLSKDKNYFYTNDDICDYPEGEIDGKIINMNYLVEAAKKGNELTRASFIKAFMPFCHEDEIHEILPKIPVYPEHERDAKIKAFYGQVPHNAYYTACGAETGNRFLTLDSLSKLVFFAARLVLAYNRILYPCPKSLFDVLKQASKMPPQFIERSNELLDKNINVNPDDAYGYSQYVQDYFSDCSISEEERVGAILDDEWRWFTNAPTLFDW